MAFTYTATIDDANGSIPAHISQAVTNATAPLSTKAQSLRDEAAALEARVVALEGGTA